MHAHGAWALELGGGGNGEPPLVACRAFFDPELAPRVLGASWKVLRAARLQARATNALDSSRIERDC